MVSCLVYLFSFFHVIREFDGFLHQGRASYIKPTNHNANDEILQPVVRAGKQVQTNENCFCFFFFFVCLYNMIG